MVCVKIVSNVVKNLYICSNYLKFLVYLVRALVKGRVHNGLSGLVAISAEKVDSSNLSPKKV